MKCTSKIVNTVTIELNPDDVGKAVLSYIEETNPEALAAMSDVMIEYSRVPDPSPMPPTKHGTTIYARITGAIDVTS